MMKVLLLLPACHACLWRGTELEDPTRQRNRYSPFHETPTVSILLWSNPGAMTTADALPEDMSGLRAAALALLAERDELLRGVDRMHHIRPPDRPAEGSGVAFARMAAGPAANLLGRLARGTGR